MEALVSEAIHAPVRSCALTERDFEERLPALSRLAFRVALVVVHCREDAEDVAQEAMLRAFRNLARLRNPERLDAWLVRTAWRLAIDRQRSAGRRERREIDGAVPQQASTDETAEAREFERALYSAMDSLPARHARTRTAKASTPQVIVPKNQMALILEVVREAQSGRIDGKSLFSVPPGFKREPDGSLGIAPIVIKPIEIARLEVGPASPRRGTASMEQARDGFPRSQE